MSFDLPRLPSRSRGKADDAAHAGYPEPTIWVGAERYLLRFCGRTLVAFCAIRTRRACGTRRTGCARSSCGSGRAGLASRAIHSCLTVCA
jgi:hypothetical protein